MPGERTILIDSFTSHQMHQPVETYTAIDTFHSVIRRQIQPVNKRRQQNYRGQKQDQGDYAEDQKYDYF